jgi:hypothetical protein
MDLLRHTLTELFRRTTPDGSMTSTRTRASATVKLLATTRSTSRKTPTLERVAELMVALSTLKKAKTSMLALSAWKGGGDTG